MYSNATSENRKHVNVMLNYWNVETHNLKGFQLTEVCESLLWGSMFSWCLCDVTDDLHSFTRVRAQFMWSLLNLPVNARRRWTGEGRMNTACVWRDQMRGCFDRRDLLHQYLYLSFKTKAQFSKATTYERPNESISIWNQETGARTDLHDIGRECRSCIAQMWWR